MLKTIKFYVLSFVLASFIIPNISFAQTVQVSDVDTSGGNTSSCVTIDNNISYKNRKNNNKDDVTNLQDFLNSVGYLSADSVTGFFGKLTESAVAKFQSNNGLVATPPGFVGVGTRAKIYEVSCNGTTDKTGVATTPSTSPYQGQTGYTSNLPDGCKPGARFSYLTGVSCDTNISNLPQGCKSVLGFSPITGQSCNRNIISQTQNCNSEQYLENGVCKNITHTCSDGRVISGMLSCETNAVAQSVNITSPNGGEVWNIGGTYNINYISASNNQSYYVYLEKGRPAGDLKPGPSSTSLLGITTPGLSSFSYTTPELVATWPRVGNNYKITLCSIGYTDQATCPSGLGDTSDNYFTITTQVDSAPPAITTTTLPSATVGVPYTGTIVSVGGKGARDWNTTGTLPPGLYLNKVYFTQGLNVTGSQPAEIGFVGAPTTAGTYTFTVEVTTGSQKVSKQLTIVVNPITVTTSPTISISASPESVSYGGQSKITWTSSGVTSCNFIEGDNQFKNYENTTSGTNRYTQSLYSTQKYTLSCSSTGRDVVKSVSVIVTPQVSQVFSYSFENTAKVILKMVVGLVPVDLKYDINKDGKVDMLDSQVYLSATSVPEVIVNADKAYLVSRMIVGTLPVDLKYDTDGDGKLTLTDSLYYTQLDINQPLTTPIINVKWGPQSNTPFNAGTSATSYSWAGACYKWTTVECGSSNVVTSGGQCVSGSRYSIDYGPTPCPVAPVSSSASATTNTVDAIAFGVYEGGPSYPRAEENVYVEIPVSAEGKVLVLTAYEQVNWILRNPNNVSISKIIAIGYKAQRVTSGDGKVLPVVENDSYTTNRIYKYAYNTSDSSFTDLVSWLATKGISLVPANFKGSYSAKGNTMFAAPLSYMLNPSSYSSQILGDFVSNASCINLPRNLHRGAESVFVKNLQNFLVSKGLLSDTPTGFYGDKTVSAVKDYQAMKGLPQTGMVYDFTRAAIKVESCK